MHPRVATPRLGHDGADRIEITGVELASLRDHDGRAFAGCDRAREWRGQHATLRVGLDAHDAIVSQPQELQCGKNAGVGVIADQHVDRRRAEQSVGLDVPADTAQHRTARGGETDEVRDGCAGDEPDGRLARKIEQVEQPLRGNGLGRRGGGRGFVVAGVLSPRGGQPVSRDANGVRRADHPAEEPRPGHCAQAGRAALYKLVDDIGRRHAGLRCGHVECGAHVRIRQRGNGMSHGIAVIGGKRAACSNRLRSFAGVSIAGG